MKNNILIEILKSVTSLCGWWLSSVGIDYSFWAVDFLWVVFFLLELDLSIPQRLFTTSRGGVIEWKILHKKFFFTLPQCLLIILALKLSRNWMKVIFVICMNRAIGKWENFNSAHQKSQEKHAPFFRCVSISINLNFTHRQTNKQTYT